MKKLLVTLVITLAAIPVAAQNMQRLISKYSAVKGAQVIRIGGEMAKKGLKKGGINIGDIDELPDGMRCDSIIVVSIENEPKLMRKFAKEASKINLEADGYSELVNTTDDGDYARIMVKGSINDASEMLIMATDHEDNSISLVRLIGKIDLSKMKDD